MVHSEGDTVICNSLVRHAEDPAYVLTTLCLEKAKEKMKKSWPLNFTSTDLGDLSQSLYFLPSVLSSVKGRTGTR